jgi:hypothetical protein
VAGQPADKLLDTRRYFYGASVDAEALTPKLGGALYLIDPKVDGLVDRRALGTEMRYFDGGLSLSGQLDQDLLLKGLNIASLQGTWQREGGTVFNLLLDRRKTRCDAGQRAVLAAARPHVWRPVGYRRHA